MGQVVKLTGANLGNPNVHLPVPVRQKRNEMAVAGEGGGLLQSIEIRDRLNSSASNRASPEVIRPLKQENYASGQRNCQRCGKRQNEASFQ